MVESAGVWEIYRESISVLIVSLVGGIFAGSVLGSPGMINGFMRFPGLLLLLPAFLATRGNVYGALGARISTGLHQGLIAPRFTRDRRLLTAITASFLNGIGISVVIAIMSWGTLRLIPTREPASLIELIAIMVIAGGLTSVVLVFGLLLLVFVGYRRGLDPDNLVGPLVTTLGDVFGVVFLLVAITVVGVIP